MPTSKRDLKMMTDNELFNGMSLVRDDEDGLNEMVDELARRAGDRAYGAAVTSFPRVVSADASFPRLCRATE